MDFGVIECVATGKSTAAPGWAYVPDTGPNVTALQPSRKRARNQITTSSHETTAKQDAKILREIEELQRENMRDVVIPIPAKSVGRASKTSSAVRKILTSQKTFQNHLEDYHALKALAPPPSTTTHAPPPPPPPTPTPATPILRTASTPHLTSTGKRSHKKKPRPNDPVPTPVRKATGVIMPPPPPVVVGKSIVLDDSEPGPRDHERDGEGLLVSFIPQMPTQEEVDTLIRAPPLSWTEAKGGFLEGNGDARRRGRTVRKFCEVCGYWGRVRCMRCGARCCALECLQTHQEECFVRYGA